MNMAEIFNLVFKEAAESLVIMRQRWAEVRIWVVNKKSIILQKN
jgi:hypothetical protein